MNITAEKSRLINLGLPRQSYERRENAEVLWMPCAENLEDSLTKKNAKPALHILLRDKKLDLHVNRWVERPVQQNHEETKTQHSTQKRPRVGLQRTDTFATTLTVIDFHLCSLSPSQSR